MRKQTKVTAAVASHNLTPVTYSNSASAGAATSVISVLTSGGFCGSDDIDISTSFSESVADFEMTPSSTPSFSSAPAIVGLVRYQRAIMVKEKKLSLEKKED
jgi:hypothetical protein